MKMKCLIFLLSTLFWFPSCYSYCTGALRDHHIAGIWRLRSSGSFLPKFKVDDFSKRPLKEFTVYPPKPEKKENPDNDNDTNDNDILLLLREDGNFVQYGRADESSKKINAGTQIIEGNSCLGTMKGSWALVDGCLILAADRSEDTKNIRSESKKHDTILSGQITATSEKGLVDNPALISQSDDNALEDDGNDNKNVKDLGKSKQTNKEDVHLSVNGEISIGKFFYPQTHPNFFEQPMFGGTLTGFFELQQILGTLNTQVDSDEDKLVEKFRKEDLVNKRYFLTSYPLPTKRQKRQRWSIKYNKYVDDKTQSKAEKDREEQEKNAPMKIKSFEVELFANNTFSTITGLGETILRGKWFITGEDRDQLSMSVWRFGFGRGVSGSTFSEGTHLSSQDDVSYWGDIFEVDAAEEEDCIMDDPFNWKGTKIEVNGAVMLGVGLEPCSIARFTMIEKTEVDSNDDEDDDDDDDDDEVLDILPDDVGSFE
mmetsp:Transcript_7181/g.10836  ORF Transcript_7181/g.10836 Transcript_7181/m.10836 type:complete len:484 (-) Transcript_7181:41-1492(-)